MIKKKESDVHCSMQKKWIKASLGDISNIEAGNPAPQGEEFFRNGKFPFVRVQDLGKLKGQIYISNTVDNINEKAILNMKSVPKGAVLFTKSGMSILLNQRAIVSRYMYVVSHIGYSVPLGNIPSEWIYYWLTMIDFKDLTHATTLPSLKLSKVKEIFIPLPPLPEQHRIIEKIEELFTKLNAGVAALEKVRAQLKRYRQAVLKAAFSGQLTAGWRQKHSNVGAGSSRPMGGFQTSDSNEGATTLQNGNLPEFPSGWEWGSIKGISKRIQYGTSSKADSDQSGIPVLRMGNLQKFKLDFDKLKYFPKNWEEKEKYLLNPGDVLFNRTNSAELVGKTAVYKTEHPKAVFASYLIRIEVDSERYDPSFLSYYMNSNFGKQYIATVVSQQVGQANVNGTKLAAMSIPMLQLKEQEQIVSEIERRFSVADEVGKTVDNALKQARRLRQSILKRAFEGKLVPQDPNDLPAPRPGKYFVYVLECSNGSLYKGHTENIEKRWCEHAGGKGAEWTQKYPPVKLVHWEEFDSLEEAVKREQDLKTGFGRKWLEREIKAGRTRQAGEPASVLLERIKAERELHKKKKRMI